jgi:hypothetical protein
MSMFPRGPSRAGSSAPLARAAPVVPGNGNEGSGGFRHCLRDLPPGGSKVVNGCGPVKRGDVVNVDDRVGALERAFKPRAGNRIDAQGAGDDDYLRISPRQRPNHMLPDRTGSADHRDPHRPPSTRPR